MALVIVAVYLFLMHMYSCKVTFGLLQVCYGMIYGIGAKALGETLGVSEEDGAAFMETFKMQYKGMRTYMTSTIKECREKGYVTTIMGRRRYLSAITNTNAGARNHVSNGHI